MERTEKMEKIRSRVCEDFISDKIYFVVKCKDDVGRRGSMIVKDGNVMFDPLSTEGGPYKPLFVFDASHRETVETFCKSMIEACQRFLGESVESSDKVKAMLDTVTNERDRLWQIVKDAMTKAGVV